MSKIKIIDSGAEMNGDKTHRYSLWRTWDYDLPRIMFIGLNPIRADAQHNDPTIARCINFAAGWGFGSMYFANLYSLRTPYVYPQKIKPDVEEQWPVLTENLKIAANNTTDDFLLQMIRTSNQIVICWGSWPFIFERACEVGKTIIYNNDNPIYCFGKNADKSPKHPLYLKSSTQLKIYAP